MSRRAPTSLFASPILVGAVTVLVGVVGVFLSYNANTGLPFVPTYDVTVTVPDAANLIPGNEVRIGGKRVGVVSQIEPVGDENGLPVAELSLKLEQQVEPIADDSRVQVRPRSTLGLKYLEITPGTEGTAVPTGGELALEQSSPVVELDDVINAFDDATRRAFQGTLDGAGLAFAGRGADVNALIEEAPPLLRRFESVARNLSDERTALRGFIRGADRFASELAAEAARLGPVVENADSTAGAFANARDHLAETLGELPATQAAATTALAAAEPVLRDAAALARDIRPGTRVLDTAGAELHRALETGIPVLRRTTALAGRLDDTLDSVEELSSDPLTRSAIERLIATADSIAPTIEYLAPFQIQCNYLGLWTRNVSSTISEGDNAGTWFRTLVVLGLPEMLPSATPSDTLHVNPYPNTAAPGQDGECEAGNEGYEPGQQIGNPEGNQGRTTLPTGPPPGVPQP
ncbi:MAG: MlaD family protein [Thermoleophilaceae bacterium]